MGRHRLLRSILKNELQQLRQDGQNAALTSPRLIEGNLALLRMASRQDHLLPATRAQCLRKEAKAMGLWRHKMGKMERKALVVNDLTRLYSRQDLMIDTNLLKGETLIS